MKNIKPLNFTKAYGGKSIALRIFLAFVLIILAGAVLFFLLLAKNDFDISRFLGTRQAEETTTETTTAKEVEETVTAPAFSDENSINILLICHTEEKKIDFCDVVSISYAENVIRVKPVSPELTLDFNGSSYSAEQLFKLSSAGAVRDALIKRGIKISRTVTFDETGFKMLLQKLGPVDIRLETETAFFVDATKYTFPAGVQKMTADTLLKYMKYSATGDKLLTVQANTLVEIIKTHFTAENIDKGEDFFASVINLANSDISAFDYTQNREKLSDFLSGNPKINAID